MNELQQRPQLSKDILHVIAEKLPVVIPRIDFRTENPYTRFMVYNQLVPKSIFPEFANFKKIVFGKHHGEEEQIGFKFYKNDNFEDSELEEFHRHIVPRGMLEEIIKNGKLRVTHIVVCHFLPDDRSTDIHELGEMNSFKAFCALFLGKQKNFETILAIDAVELEMSNNDDVLMLVRMDFSQYKSSIIANNTTKISIHCQVDVHFFIFKQIREKFATNFEALCSFLIRICPNLKHLRVIIHLSLNVDSIDFSIDEFTDNLHFTIATIEAVIKSINIGDEHLQISIHFIAEFPSYIYKKLPLGSTDLFKPFAFFLSVGNRDDKIVSSHFMPPFNDARGRIHQFFFTSLRDESDFDKDDSMDTSDDDNDDEEEDGDEDEDGEEDGNNEEEDGDEEDEVGDEEEEDDEDEVGNTDEDEVGDVEFDYEDEPY